MKAFIYLLLCLPAASPVFCQDKDPYADSARLYFNEIKAATEQHPSIWKLPLYGPLLLIDPITRRYYTNYNDTALALTATGSVYTGTLPASRNMANTAIELGSRRWAMILLPLPADKHDRVNLLAHELFHRIQPSLGFRLSNPANNHLDEKDGRIYLRLELAALRSALEAKDAPGMKAHLTHAITFRKYRYLLYPGADTTENALEIAEGLAEYTGMIYGGRDTMQARLHFEHDQQRFLSNPTFVRSFAYQTTPIYGYLLQQTVPYWNQAINTHTNLTDHFIRAFALSIPEDIRQAATSFSSLYGGDTVSVAETARAAAKREAMARYKQLFIIQPHLDIKFVKMNVSFNPSNIQPLEDKGTVYPTIRVTDEWGILDASKGALMSPGWDRISVSVPEKTEGKNVSGEGWTLILNEGWKVVKDEADNGNYKLVKQ